MFAKRKIFQIRQTAKTGRLIYTIKVPQRFLPVALTALSGCINVNEVAGRDENCLMGCRPVFFTYAHFIVYAPLFITSAPCLSPECSLL